MKAQLYLYDELRKKLKKPIELYKQTYSNKILSLFSNVEEEAQKIANQRFRELGQYFNPDYHDEADFADEAWNAGFEHYESMSLMRYNTKLMWISTLYQFWEQQVRKFIFEEVTRTHIFINKKGNEVQFKNFCTKGIDDIKEQFQEFNQDLEKLPCWTKINELRLLTNVIKHGDGWSATQLKTLRADFFKAHLISSDLLDLYKTTLDEVVLNIDDNEFQEYCEAIIQFWNLLPERMYTK